MAIALVLAGTVAVVAGLVGLLYAFKAAGERLARADDSTPAAVRPLVASEGFLSPDEEAAAAANARDFERLAAIERIARHRSNQIFEWALSELRLDQTWRNVVRSDLAGYPLVGAR